MLKGTTSWWDFVSFFTSKMTTVYLSCHPLVHDGVKLPISSVEGNLFL